MSAVVTGRRLHRLHHIARARASEVPGLYLPLARRKYPGPSPEVIGAETELVIDGYTRCGSTFAVYAFQLAQPRPVRLAHHLHAPAQLISAAERGVPALALIRDPAEAVLSQLVREPTVHPVDALIAFARFYEKLAAYSDRLVVADYTEVTTSMGDVVVRLNERFGTTFSRFEHTPAALAECRSFMSMRPAHAAALLGFESGTTSRAELERARELDPAAFVSHGRDDSWLPSPEREADKNALRDVLDSAAVRGPLLRARSSYTAFVSG